MKLKMKGIALLLMAILLTLSFGDESFFHLDFQWHTVFVLMGLAGVIMTFLPEKKKEYGGESYDRQ